MVYEFKRRQIVELVETDLAGIMHFSNYFRYMEATEAAFLRSLGEPLCEPNPFPSRGLPKVHAECDYQSPLRFEDEVEIHLLVREIRRQSIIYEFIFNRVSQPVLPEIARGKLIVVHVELDAKNQVMQPAPLPLELLSKIEPAPPSEF